MKQQIATTREQSARLLKCGVPAESADMHWHGAIVPRGGSLTDPPYPSEEWDLFNSPYWLMPEEMQKAKLMEDFYEIAPAFCLSTLLELMPSKIIIETSQGIEIYAVKFYFYDNGNRVYNIAYVFLLKPLLSVTTDSPIEAAVQMIEQLTANGYQLNGIEKGGSEHGED